MAQDHAQRKRVRQRALPRSLPAARPPHAGRRGRRRHDLHLRVRAAKLGGGHTAGGQSRGFADVFKRGFFGWKYKGKHANLDKAFQQLLQCRESLHNPPLLVVSDIDTIFVHPNIVNRANRPTTLTLDDLLLAGRDGRAARRFHRSAPFREPRDAGVGHAAHRGRLRPHRRPITRGRSCLPADRPLPDPPALLPLRRGCGAAAAGSLCPAGRAHPPPAGRVCDAVAPTFHGDGRGRLVRRRSDSPL